MTIMSAFINSVQGWHSDADDTNLIFPQHTECHRTNEV